VMILAIDHRNVHRRVTQGSRCPQSPETSADDYNARHYTWELFCNRLNVLWRAQGIRISSVCSVLYFCHGSTLTKVCYILLFVIAYSKMKISTTSISHQTTYHQSTNLAHISFIVL